MPDNLPASVCVVGLGYVGLPLAVAFSQRFPTVGYDCNAARVAELQRGEDATGEVSSGEFTAGNLSFTGDIAEAAHCDAYVVAVPTPVHRDNRPDLKPLDRAVAEVGGVLAKGDLVVVESTVYPGVTEDRCAPALAAASGLEAGEGFHIGYSPERINPGDSTRRLADILKVTSGATPAAAERVDALYREVIRAGTFPVSSVRAAEAAKVMENTQRDVNIALINEFAMILDSMGVDSAEALRAASSKWNFIPFQPGLVGGHCIGVDPYYLSYKSEEAGFRPDLILTARQINDGMGRYIAEKTVKLIIARGKAPKGAKVLLLGLAFKENCADLRNTKVADIHTVLDAEYGCDVSVCDPVASPDEARDALGIELTPLPDALSGRWDAVVFAVAHEAFEEIKAESLGDAVVVDVKGRAPRADWRL